MPLRADPPALHARALDELRFIRSTMERAAAFTAVPGWGGVWMGITALAATPLAGVTRYDAQWLAVWLAEAVLATTIALFGIFIKTHATGARLAAAPAKRFALAFTPALVAGAMLTVVFAQNGLISRLPGCWLLLYGTGLTAGGALSVGVVPAMGAVFMLLGGVAFLSPAGWGPYFLALGFGGAHIGFGVVIARRYGG